MSEVWRSRNEGGYENAKPRVGALASRQAGRVTARQLQWLGISRTTIRRWVRAGYLFQTRPPGVYAVGHPGDTSAAAMWEAILYAGPEAMLSNTSAAHRRGLIRYPPPVIHVSTPRRTRSLPGIVVHGRRALAREEHRGIPITSDAQIVCDLAADGELRLVRRALAVLDYEHLLDVRAIHALCGPGRPGSALLSRALAGHEPLLGRTRSELEDDWLILICAGTGVPRPDGVNVDVHGIECDVVYRAARLDVELDGEANHHSRAQLAADRTRERTLRAHGWEVRRYGHDEIHRTPRAVRDDLTRTLAQRSTLASDGGRADALSGQA